MLSSHFHAYILLRNTTFSTSRLITILNCVFITEWGTRLYTVSYISCSMKSEHPILLSEGQDYTAPYITTRVLYNVGVCWLDYHPLINVIWMAVGCERNLSEPTHSIQGNLWRVAPSGCKVSVIPNRHHLLPGSVAQPHLLLHNGTLMFAHSALPPHLVGQLHPIQGYGRDPGEPHRKAFLEMVNDKVQGR